jgi:hypothetical protein
MNAISMTVVSSLFGGGYLLVAAAFGDKLARLAWRHPDEELRELRGVAAPMFGIVAHALLAAVALALAPAALPWLLWLMLAVVCIDLRGTRRYLADNWKALGLALGYGAICYAVLVSYHVGAGRGDNLFWSIYNLTAVTPGDSPQGLLQAQYLLHGQSLAGLRDFSLFDRPFLGGLVSLAALGSVGELPGKAFNDFPPHQAYLYIALWTWLNATFALAVAAIARRVLPPNLRLPALLLVLCAPFLVFNAIGAWPKLLAAYFTSIAALLALGGRWRWAVVASGVAFLTHGSFLWSHLSLAGLLVIYVALFTQRRARWLEGGLLAAIAFAFPALWFLAEHHYGSATPLRTYYLYAVPVNYGLTHDAAEIARQFYASTSPGNLALLPFMNLLKALVPAEMLNWLLAFSMAGPGTDLRRLASALFYTQFNRPLFALCLTAGVVAMLGLRRGLTRDWKLALAVAAFFLLPLLPGLGLYRRDDHFITPTMLFAVIPLLLAFFNGLAELSRRTLTIVATLMMAEYLLLYWSRYPEVRYQSDFYEYYLWLCVALLACAFVVVVRLLARQPQAAPAAPARPFAAAGIRGVRMTPARVAGAALAVVVLGGLCSPLLVRSAIGDGGFARHGWNIDLSRWPDLQARRDGQALLHTNMRVNENGVEHAETWINSGQGLTFRNVPTSDVANFSVLARVHPAWNAGAPLPPIVFRVSVVANGEQRVAEVKVDGAREQAGEWQRIEVPLSPFSGRAVDIQMEPIAQQPGVWTLWRDPAVTPKPQG